MNILDQLNEAYPVRRSEGEKQAFRTYVEERYGARTEITADVKNKNLIIGDPAKARVVCTAHYDTPAASLFPNLMIPRNSFVFYLYQFLIVGVILAVAIGGGLLIGQLAGGTMEATLIGYLVLYYLIYFLAFRAFPNKRNANDNTSGVATVLALAERYAGEDVAFILFDNEEGGKKGSRAYYKDHKDGMQNKLLINFDCVGNGEHMIFIAQKGAEEREELIALRAAFTPEAPYTVQFYPAKGSQCNSDHKNFPCGIGCMACRKTRGGLFYTPYIHTGRDRVASHKNVSYLADRMGVFFASLRAE